MTASSHRGDRQYVEAVRAGVFRRVLVVVGGVLAALGLIAGHVNRHLLDGPTFADDVDEIRRDEHVAAALGRGAHRRGSSSATRTSSPCARSSRRCRSASPAAMLCPDPTRAGRRVGAHRADRRRRRPRRAADRRRRRHRRRGPQRARPGTGAGVGRRVGHAGVGREPGLRRRAPIAIASAVDVLAWLLPAARRCCASPSRCGGHVDRWATAAAVGWALDLGRDRRRRRAARRRVPRAPDRRRHARRCRRAGGVDRDGAPAVVGRGACWPSPGSAVVVACSSSAHGGAGPPGDARPGARRRGDRSGRPASSCGRSSSPSSASPRSSTRSACSSRSSSSAASGWCCSPSSRSAACRRQAARRAGRAPTSRRRGPAGGRVTLAVAAVAVVALRGRCRRCSPARAATSTSRRGRAARATVCNGHAELCDRSFDEVAYVASHNAMSVAGEPGWFLAEQAGPDPGAARPGRAGAARRRLVRHPGRRRRAHGAGQLRRGAGDRQRGARARDRRRRAAHRRLGRRAGHRHRGAVPVPRAVRDRVDAVARHARRAAHVAGRQPRRGRHAVHRGPRRRRPHRRRRRGGRPAAVRAHARSPASRGRRSAR